MAFTNPVLPPNCTWYHGDSVSEPFQDRGEINKFKHDRDESYYAYVRALHSYWQSAYKEEVNEATNRKLDHGVENKFVKEKRAKLLKNNSSFEKAFEATIKVKTDESFGPPCTLYGSFLNVRNLHPKPNDELQLSFQEVRSSDNGDDGGTVKQICQYLDYHYPDNPEYAYHFPVSYTCETGKSDIENISKQLFLEGPKCLSYYSDKILRELCDLKQVDESTKGFVYHYLKKRNALKAVQSVCQSIELCCHEQRNIHMFIMANVNYMSYLRQYNHRQKPVTASQGDHDILLISQEVGIIFIQVKSCKGHSGEIVTTRKKEAFKQLVKDKFVFLESNRDLDFISPKFPMWGFIALPNVSNERLLQIPLCEGHRKIVLGKENFVSMDWLVDLLTKCRDKGTNASIWTREQFRFVSARYVGEGKSKGTQHLSRAIEETFKMFGRKIFTPEQNEILEKRDNSFQVITGDFGSGKSLILCKKIYDLAKPNHDSNPKKIYLVTCVGLDKQCSLNTKFVELPATRQLKEYIEGIENQHEITKRPKREGSEKGKVQEKGKVTDKIEIMTLARLFTEYCAKEQKNYQNIELVTAEVFHRLFSFLISEGVSIFIDEMPLQLFKDCEKLIFSETNNAKGNHVWVSIATQSCYEKSQGQNETIASNGSSQFVSSNMFQSNNLTENMRNSCSIWNLMRSITDYTEEIFPQSKPNSSHSIEGPLPLLFRVPRCSCPNVESKYTIFCTCLEKRLEDTLEYVHNVILGTKKTKADVIYMVSHFYNDTFYSPIFAKLQSVFEKIFTRLGKNYFWLTLADTQSGKNYNEKSHFKELIVDQTTYTGGESAIVINIDLLSMWQWLPRNVVGPGSLLVISRCTSQYVHIVLQGDEPKVFIEEHITMFEEQRNQTSDESMQERYDRAVQIMQRCLQNRGELLKRLLLKGVMIEKYDNNNSNEVVLPKQLGMEAT